MIPRLSFSVVLALVAASHRAITLAAVPRPSEGAPSTVISFSLQQEYDLYDEHDGPQAAFRVSSEAMSEGTPTTFGLRARPTTIYRPRSTDAVQHARLRSLYHAESEPVEWEQVETSGPDIEDQYTLSQLARMTANAYALPMRKNWYNLDPAWNLSFPFGWEDDADGFRGHVFTSPSNETVVLAIKGTTLQGPTSAKDKFNDNLLFSCCCARIDLSWIFSTVCDCYEWPGWRCDSACLSDALIQDSLFYTVGVHLISDIMALYPNSTIWLVGHSLGGSLASLLGTTFGLPAVAFEAPGERLAAQRLHLPLPPQGAALTAHGSAPVTHVYHNADPIPQGACTGIKSLCQQAGYALETRCHLGKSVVYDTVGVFKWRVDVTKHKIACVIREVIDAHVEGGWEKGEDGLGRMVPIAREEVNCADCGKWDFKNFRDKVT